MPGKRHKGEQHETQIVALATSGLTHAQIAQVLQMSSATVARVLKRKKEDVRQIDKKLAEAQGHIKRKLPIAKRVEELARIATKSDMDFARLGAIKYIDALDGLHPELEREKVRSEREQQQPAPMFIFPPGTNVDVTVNQIKSADSASAIREPETIDTTADPIDEI